MRKDMLEVYIKNLRRSFGLKPPVPEENMRRLYDAKDYHGLTGAIMSTMKIDLRVNLGLVNSGGPAAPAWLRRPYPLPPINSSLYRNTVVTIFLRKTFLAEAGFESVVLAISHELSHVILDSEWHELRTKEEAVDLNAMLSGFRDFYMTGARTKGGGRIGYLTQDEISYAAWFMTFGK